jgi:transposase
MDAGAHVGTGIKARPFDRGVSREAVMADRPHPEQGFRTCLGVLALARSYDPVRLDAACRRGLSIRARSVASIRSILKTGLDRAFLEEEAGQLPLQPPNIRGQGYYH